MIDYIRKEVIFLLLLIHTTTTLNNFLTASEESHQVVQVQPHSYYVNTVQWVNLYINMLLLSSNKLTLQVKPSHCSKSSPAINYSKLLTIPQLQISPQALSNYHIHT